MIEKIPCTERTQDT